VSSVVFALAAGIEDDEVDALRNSLSSVIVSVTRYTALDRARILYNHLYYSSLADEARTKFVEGRYYQGAVTHRHYNPRLVSEIIEIAEASETPPHGFPDLFVQSLDDPTSLWTNIFHRQLGTHDRALLAALRIFDGEPVSAVREAWKAICGAMGIDSPSSLRFNDSLRILEPTFVRVSIWGEQQRVHFANPGVEDVVSLLLQDEGELVDAAIRSADYRSLANLDEWSSPRGRSGDLLELTPYRESVRALAEEVLGWDPPIGSTEEAVQLANLIARSGLSEADVPGLKDALARAGMAEGFGGVRSYVLSLPSEIRDSVETELVDGLTAKLFELDFLGSGETLVEAAEFAEYYGIDVEPIHAEIQDQVADTVRMDLEAIRDNELAFEVDSLVFAAEHFGVAPSEQLVAQARENEGRYEPDEDDWRERDDYRSGDDDVSDIDRLFGSLI
jgi:hypothetical protein